MPSARALAAAAFLTLALTLAAQAAPWRAAQPDHRRGAREPAWAPDGASPGVFVSRSHLALCARWPQRQAASAGHIGCRTRSGMVARRARRSSLPPIAVRASTSSSCRRRGGDARHLTTLPGDERWPSWTSDGRVVFSHRASGRWRLYAVAASGGEPKPLFSDTAGDDEQQGRVSPDGKRVAYVSDRESDDGDHDLWVADLAPGPRDRVTRLRLVRVRGIEGFPAWSPEGSRLAFFAVREATGGVWVIGVPDVLVPPPAPPGSQPDGGPAPRPRAVEAAMLVSRHGGAPAWSPDGRRLAIANLPPPDPTYNGNPERNTDEPPPLFAGADAFRLWLVDAPLPVDSGEREIVDRAAPRQPAPRGIRSRLGDAAASLLFLRAIGRAAGRSSGRSTARRRRRPRTKPGSSPPSTRWSRNSRSSSRSSSRIAPSSSPGIRWPREPARSRSKGAATSSMRPSPCRSRSACSSRMPPALAETAWRSCTSRGWPSRSRSTTRIRCRSARRATTRC